MDTLTHDEAAAYLRAAAKHLAGLQETSAAQRLLRFTARLVKRCKLGGGR